MDFITYEKKGHIARIVLSRENKYNAFVRQMALELQNCLDQAENDQDIRVIYITGKGKAFCSGQDLQEAIDPDNGIGVQKILNEHYNPIILKIREIEKPVVCAVNGVAAGAGANIALASDLTIATKSSKFIQAFSKIGLIPDSGGTFFLPRLIGLQRATALCMLGDPIGAEEAEKIGMIYKCVEDEEFESASWDCAERLAALPPIALKLTKRALNRSLESELERQLGIEEELQSVAEMSNDYKEGVNAFLEKRAPKYTGS